MGVTVVLQTAVNPKSAANRAQACIPIGFSVFLAHTVLIPIDGCSINPTRTFGPAIIGGWFYNWEDHISQASKQLWLYLIAPCLGSVLAAGVYLALQKCDPDLKQDK